MISYLRPIWEDKNGEPSIRRVLALVFALGIIRMVEHSYKNDCNINNDALMTLCGTMLILLGLITWQNIKDFKQTNDRSNNNQTNSVDPSQNQGGSTEHIQ